MHSYLIVIFNESVFDTSTYKSLIEMLAYSPHASSLHVWDNSKHAQHSRKDFDEVTDIKVYYYHSPRNEHLSVVYNQVLDKCFNEHYSYVTILDQDSYIPLDFKELFKGASDAKLIIPTIYSAKSGRMISPRYQSYNYFSNKCTTHYFDSPTISGFYPSRNFFAVASGMTISKSLWQTGIRFCEKLSFYGVDTEFCVDYALNNQQFFVISAKFKHSASNEDLEDYDKFKWRLNKYYEHWYFQLTERAGVPGCIATPYVRSCLQFNLWKNLTKRLFHKN